MTPATFLGWTFCFGFAAVTLILVGSMVSAAVSEHRERRQKMELTKKMQSTMTEANDIFRR